MADDPKAPEPPQPPDAADKPAGHAPGEPLKAEAPVPGASGRPPVPTKTAEPAPSPQGTAAAKPAPARPAPTAGAKPAAPAASRPAAAAPKPAAAGEAHVPKAAPPSGPPDPPPPADKTPPGFVATLQAAFPGAVSAVSYWVGDWTIIVAPERIVDVARHLRDAPDARFDMCSDLTATDWPPRAERFDVLYCLYSTRHRHRVRVKVKVAEHQPLASVTSIWPAANWFEREVFDMFGVNFTGHPDRRRILMPEDWQGYPQRKDYPLEGPGELLMENPLDWLKLRQAKDEADIE